MKKQPVQSATSLPPSPDEERRGRMLMYSLAMGIRMLCVVAFFFLHGWWLVAPIVGAIILPYIAVVIANTVRSGASAVVQRPGAVMPVPLTHSGEGE
ncbi:MAG: hypothetical protein QOI02_1246 [Actinomycetota bacterium]|jgi:uncharacterized membrane protein|nr:hypothetical protein [Actinomycetota bacterium]